MPKPAPPSKASKNKALSTQRYLQFAAAKNDVLVLKNGGIRAILEVTSLNFNLKSEDEQKAIISSYQQFLNALNFPVQILCKSRKLDIDLYLARLRKREGEIQNPLLQKQMTEYIQYIQKLVEYADIMEKRFFVVVPVNPVRASSTGVFSSFLKYIAPDDKVLEIIKRQKEFKNLKKDLDSRVNVVRTSLENCGLSVSQLTTEQVISLFYQSYNPQTSRNQKLQNLENTPVQNPEDSLISSD